MEISGKNNSIQMLNYTREADVKQRAPSDGFRAGAPDPPQDKVALSGKAREIQAAVDHLQNVSEVRPQKVDALKQQLEKGTYRVDGKTIAFKLMQESILNQFL